MQWCFQTALSAATSFTPTLLVRLSSVAGRVRGNGPCSRPDPGPRQCEGGLPSTTPCPVLLLKWGFPIRLTNR